MPVNPQVTTTPVDGGLTVVDSARKRIAIAGVATNITYGYYKLSFESAGYTAAVPSDIGKPVVGGTTSDSGTLAHYDNSAREWWVTPDAADDTFDTAETITITGGTGTGDTSGAASLDTPAALIETLHTTDAQAVKSWGVSGELIEAACHVLNNATNVAVDLVAVDASVAGSVGAVTTTRVGSSACTLTVSETTAYDDFEVVVVSMATTSDFTAGDGEFRYSLDGGDSFSNNIAIPVSGVYPIPGTGLEITFSTGNPDLDEGDQFEFDCVGPGYSAADLATALTALFNDPYHWQVLGVMGRGSSASASASLAATVKTMIEQRATAKYWSWAVMQAGINEVSEGEADLISAFAATTSIRLGVCAGDVELDSSLTPGRKYKRGLVYCALCKVAQDDLQEDMGKVKNGSLTGVGGFYNLDGTPADTVDWPALDNAKFITPKTWEHNGGYFICQGNIMCPDGSSFDLHQLIQVMNEACRITHQFLNTLPGEELRNKPDGTIADEDAEALDDQLSDLLAAGLVYPENVQAIQAKVDRTINLATTRKVTANVTLVPFNYAKIAEGYVGFAISVSG